MKALSQPLFASLHGYDRAQLGPDLFSGALIALLSIPISMGYAQLAGLPPVYGLYGSLVPILLFAMLSTTREFIFGVDAAPAAMIGAVLASLGVTPGGAEAMRIVPVLTLYVALWLAVFALVHADKAVDYISEPVMGGFISGVCCEIILMQVPKLLGSATGTGELFELLGHVFDAAKVINWPTAALGFGTLAILLIAPRKWPKVPWVPVMMVAGGLLGAFAPLDDWGVALLAAVCWGFLHFLFMITQVKGMDMFPAVKDGDLAIVFRMQQEYAKNDVIAYRTDTGTKFGRIVARATDVVTIDDNGSLTVNGTTQTGEILYPTYPDEDGSLTYPYTVPENSVFVLGDYRTRATDSRLLGAVSLDQVEGKVITILRRRGL